MRRDRSGRSHCGAVGRGMPHGIATRGHGRTPVPFVPSPGRPPARVNVFAVFSCPLRSHNFKSVRPCVGVPTACPSFLDKDIANPTQGDDLRSLKVGPGEGVAAGKAGYRFAVGRPGDQIGVHSPRSAPPSNQSPRRIMRVEAPIGFTDRLPVGLNYSCAPRGFT